jgi:hypothetical protein
MPDYAPLIQQIAEQTSVEFRAAPPAELAKLEALGVPESILAFYREFEPSECAEAQVRLWPIEHVLKENEAYVPGAYASKHGYIVFSTTLCGDTYCFDLAQRGRAEPRIVLFSHEMIAEDTTAPEYERLAKPVAGSLHEFLRQFIRGELDEECIYS